MVEKSVSEAVRELEQLLDEGFLSEEQFRREVRELLERREDVPSETGSAAPAAPSVGLGDMVRHAAPVDFSEDTEFELESTPEIFDGPESVPAPEASARAEAPAQERKVGRVIITGKIPWDDKGSERVRLSVPGRSPEDQDEAPFVHGSARRPLNPIQREELARMAERTNKVINKRKNPDIAFFLSFLLPGLGHAYHGNLGLGMALMVLGGAGWVGVAMQELWVLYVLAPLCLLTGALAHRTVQQRNNFIDQRRIADERRELRESRLNVEKSIRQAGAPPASRKS